MQSLVTEQKFQLKKTYLMPLAPSAWGLISDMKFPATPTSCLVDEVAGSDVLFLDPGEPTWCGSWVGKPHHTDCVLCLVEKIVWPNWLFVHNAPHVFEHVNKLWQGSRMRLGVTGHWVMLWALGIHNGYHVTNSDVGALLRTQTSEFVTWLLDYTYMGQFLQDRKNVCLTALFLK